MLHVHMHTFRIQARLSSVLSSSLEWVLSAMATARTRFLKKSPIYNMSGWRILKSINLPSWFKSSVRLCPPHPRVKAAIRDALHLLNRDKNGAVLLDIDCIPDKVLENIETMCFRSFIFCVTLSACMLISFAVLPHLESWRSSCVSREAFPVTIGHSS